MESGADANHSDQESYYVLYHKENEVFYTIDPTIEELMTDISI